MEVQWFRQDKPAVLDALRRGERPLMATTRASGPLDELIALHMELGVFAALDGLPANRQRAGIDDALLFRTLATLPFLPESGLDPAARLFFRSPRSCCNWGGRPPRSRRATISGIGIPKEGGSNRCRAIRTPCAMRFGESRRRPGYGCNRRVSRACINVSWSKVRSMRSMALGWATTFVWSAWSVSRRGGR